MPFAVPYTICLECCNFNVLKLRLSLDLTQSSLQKLTQANFSSYCLLGFQSELTERANTLARDWPTRWPCHSSTTCSPKHNSCTSITTILSYVPACLETLLKVNQFTWNHPHAEKLWFLQLPVLGRMLKACRQTCDSHCRQSYPTILFTSALSHAKAKIWSTHSGILSAMFKGWMWLQRSHGFEYVWLATRYARRARIWWYV